MMQQYAMFSNATLHMSRQLVLLFSRSCSLCFLDSLAFVFLSFLAVVFKLLAFVGTLKLGFLLILKMDSMISFFEHAVGSGLGSRYGIGLIAAFLIVLLYVVAALAENMRSKMRVKLEGKLFARLAAEARSSFQKRKRAVPEKIVDRLISYNKCQLITLEGVCFVVIAATVFFAILILSPILVALIATVLVPTQMLLLRQSRRNSKSESELRQLESKRNIFVGNWISEPPRIIDEADPYVSNMELEVELNDASKMAVKVAADRANAAAIATLTNGAIMASALFVLALIPHEHDEITRLLISFILLRFELTYLQRIFSGLAIIARKLDDVVLVNKYWG